MRAHRVRFLDPSRTVREGVWTADGIRSGPRRFDHDSVDILPPSEPTKIVCAARNYADAVEEVPPEPDLFLKPPSALAGHDAVVAPPSACGRLLFEGELAVVIGQQCRSIPESDVSEVIAGFSCANDITNDGDEGTFYRKAFDGSCPIGPAIAPPEALLEGATLELRVNGETRQRAATDGLVYSIEELISTASEYATLNPGDVVLTGTPAGRGPLRDGDRVAVSIEGIGTLTHTIRQS